MQQMFPCHNCGWQNVIGQRFCGNCAEVFQYNCPCCGIIVDPEYTSCPNCNAALVWGFQQQVVEEQPHMEYDQQHSQSSYEQYPPIYEEIFSNASAPVKEKKVLDIDKLRQKKKNQLIVIIAFIGLMLCIGGAIYLGLQTLKSMNPEPPLSAIENNTSQYYSGPTRFAIS